jgi:hypothetical protein
VYTLNANVHRREVKSSYMFNSLYRERLIELSSLYPRISVSPLQASRESSYSKVCTLSSFILMFLCLYPLALFCIFIQSEIAKSRVFFHLLFLFKLTELLTFLGS